MFYGGKGSVDGLGWLALKTTLRWLVGKSAHCQLLTSKSYSVSLKHFYLFINVYTESPIQRGWFKWKSVSLYPHC